uniref:Uncharacterized protein n=1 Tax=Globisporangium ultimum (strain ATCC 200006 / CBS 805.95 / DAOM BR144) TaxID=431595 RepID=K3W8Y7_GLOUD
MHRLLRAAYFDSSDNFIAYQSLVRYINVHGEGHVRMREVVRNFSDDTLSVYLVITVIEPTTATGKTINAISVRWRKWIIVSSQDTQETIESGCTTSLVQSYQTVTPEVIHRNYEPFWNTNLLQGMIQVWDASLSVIQRRLESHLMEQGTRSSQ